jgi:hypothetical protein
LDIGFFDAWSVTVRIFLRCYNYFNEIFLGALRKIAICKYAIYYKGIFRQVMALGLILFTQIFINKITQDL